MNIIQKIFGIKYKVDKLYFNSRENAAIYFDQLGDHQSEKECKKVWFAYSKETSDESFERSEAEREKLTGYKNHRDR